MAVFADRVQETTTTTGTGTLDLAGAVSKFRTFVSGIGTTKECYYCIVHRSVAEWEVGLGTVTDASPDTLSRDSIHASSNSGSAVNFSAGTKDVYVTSPARYIPRTGINAIINGGFRVAQRGTSFIDIDDVTYTLDRWYGLSDGDAAIDVRQNDTILIDGGYGSMLLSVDTVGNVKFGICQIIEGKDVAKLFKQGNGKVSLSFDAKILGTGIGNVKAVVLAWNGTEDVVASDVVSAWNDDGVTPTWVFSGTGWVQENIPANLNVSATAARYKIENIALDTSGTNNLAVFIWNDDKTTTGGSDHLYLARVKLEPGEVATDYEERPYAEELALCQRYARMLRAVDASIRIGNGFAETTTSVLLEVNLASEMRAAPSISMSNPADFFLYDGATSTTVNAVAGGANQWTGQITIGVASGLTQFRPYQMRSAGSGVEWILLDSEL